MAAIRPIDASWDDDFLYRVVQGNEDYLKSLGTGTTFKTISKQHLAGIQVPQLEKMEQKAIGTFLAWLERSAGDEIDFRCAPSLPARLQDVLQMVARVEALAAKIEEAQALRRQVASETDVLSRSAFQHASGLRPEWPVVRLEELCEDIIDTLHSNPAYSENGVACIRSPDVGWGRIDLIGARRTSEDEYRRRTVRGEPRENDIVFVREGGGTGKAAIVEGGQRFSLGQRVMLLRPRTSSVLPLFLLHQLLSPIVYDDQVVPLTKGSASPHLNIGTLRRFCIQLPPLPKQRQIVAYLEELKTGVDSLKQLQVETEAELNALMPAILDQVFRGEL